MRLTVLMETKGGKVPPLKLMLKLTTFVACADSIAAGLAFVCMVAGVIEATWVVILGLVTVSGVGKPAITCKQPPTSVEGALYPPSAVAVPRGVPQIANWN